MIGRCWICGGCCFPTRGHLKTCGREVPLQLAFG